MLIQLTHNISVIDFHKCVFLQFCFHDVMFLRMVIQGYYYPLKGTKRIFSLIGMGTSQANNVFTLPVTHGPFSLSNIFTQQSILQKQQLDSASRKMTKSWSLNVINSKCKIKLTYMLSWVIIPHFPSSFQKRASSFNQS